MAYRVEVTTGPQTGESYPLDSAHGTIIGRNPANNIYLQDRSVSRSHCQIKMDSDAGHCVVEDLGSTNGTFVNGERVTERRLNEGDLIQLGIYKLRLVRYDDENGSMISTTMLQNQNPDK